MRRRRLLALTALAGLALGACSDPPERARRLPAATASDVAAETTSSTTEVPATTEAPPATTAVAAEAPPGMGPGARGPGVLALEQRLDALRYDVGTVDDVFDRVTGHAVMAFQKVNGMERTGRATDDVVAATTAAKAPTALVPGGGATRVEVDIPRQVLMLYEGDQLARILPVSTGSNQRFCSEGYCRKAVTPGGSFTVGRRARGWETGPLGSLYNPLYFNGGIAIHGAQSVPASPASHGCVRIPMNAAEWFPARVASGTPVYVIANAGEVPAPVVTTVPTTAPSQTAVPPTTVAEPAVTTTSTTVAPLLGGLLSPPTSVS